MLGGDVHFEPEERIWLDVLNRAVKDLTIEPRFAPTALHTGVPICMSDWVDSYEFIFAPLRRCEHPRVQLDKEVLLCDRPWCGQWFHYICTGIGAKKGVEGVEVSDLIRQRARKALAVLKAIANPLGESTLVHDNYLKMQDLAHDMLHGADTFPLAKADKISLIKMAEKIKEVASVERYKALMNGED